MRLTLSPVFRVPVLTTRRFVLTATRFIDNATTIERHYTCGRVSLFGWGVAWFRK